MPLSSDSYIYKPGAKLPGTPYEIERQLGAGGMGVVYAARDAFLGRLVALKTIHPELVDRDDIAQRLKKEATMLAKMDHENVVKVWNAGVIEDRWRMPYFAMEMLDGTTLRATMRKDPLRNVDYILSIAHDVLAALDEAHAHRIIHRDVKPENIFLARKKALSEGPDVVTKLLDFGIIAILGGRQSRQFRGTFKYAAPEQLRGDPVSPQTDIYGAALVVYEMLAGRGPFDDIREWPMLAKAHLETEPPPLSRFLDVPKEVDELFRSALAKDPAKRPATAKAFGNKLWAIKKISFGPSRAAQANKTEETLLTALDLTDRREDAPKSDEGSLRDRTMPDGPPVISNDTVEQPPPVFERMGDTLENAAPPPGASPASPAMAFEPTDVDRNAVTRSLDLGGSDPAIPTHGTEPLPKDLQFESPVSSSSDADEPSPSSTRFVDLEEHVRGVRRAGESNETPPPSVVRSRRQSRTEVTPQLRRVSWPYVALGVVVIALAFVSIGVAQRLFPSRDDRASANESPSVPSPRVNAPPSASPSSPAPSAPASVSVATVPEPPSSSAVVTTPRAPASTRRSARPVASAVPAVSSSAASAQKTVDGDLTDPAPTPTPSPTPIPPAPSDVKRTITH